MELVSGSFEGEEVEVDSLSSEGEEVEVDSLSSEGDGVGRLSDERVVFVRGGVPGDLVVLDRIQPERAAELAENLLAWIGRGGFLPGGGKLRISSLKRFLRDTIPDEEPDDNDE